jgi:hypothetical protein
MERSTIWGHQIQHNISYLILNLWHFIDRSHSISVHISPPKPPVPPKHIHAQFPSHVALSSTLYRPVSPSTPEIQNPQELHTWKKNRTIKTCSPAMQIIIKLSITLKLKILLSVLLTVLKFLFSLVLKYFWLRVIVESCPESLNIDSSNADVCSGVVPCLEGIDARTSFSTYMHHKQPSVIDSTRKELLGLTGKSLQQSRNRRISLRTCSSGC